MNIFSKLKKANKKEDNIGLESHQQTNLNEDRIAKLERSMEKLNDKMEKILGLLSNK